MDYKFLLKSKQLSLTRGRIKILKVLAETRFPISGKEIEQQMKGHCDRASIFRNLNVMVAKGIIERVLSEGSVKYNFIPSGKKDSEKKDHIHFQCESCSRIICMEDLLVDDFPLPEGYSKIENQFLILGICKNCNHG